MVVAPRTHVQLRLDGDWYCNLLEADFGRLPAGLPSGRPAQPAVRHGQGAVPAIGVHEPSQVHDLARPVRRPLRHSPRLVPRGAGRTVACGVDPSRARGVGLRAGGPDNSGGTRQPRAGFANARMADGRSHRRYGDAGGHGTCHPAQGSSMPDTRNAIPNRVATSSGSSKPCSRGTGTTGAGCMCIPAEFGCRR